MQVGGILHKTCININIRGPSEPVCRAEGANSNHGERQRCRAWDTPISSSISGSVQKHHEMPFGGQGW